MLARSSTCREASPPLSMQTTLTAAHVEEAAPRLPPEAALPKPQGSPYKELHAGIIYGLLAHSHSGQGGFTAGRNVENALWTADSAYIQHPRECIDFITVSDLATWQSQR